MVLGCSCVNPTIVGGIQPGPHAARNYVTGAIGKLIRGPATAVPLLCEHH
jgi:hypothetical protein